MKALPNAPYSQTGEGKLKLVVINVHIKGPHLIFDKPITIGMIMSFSPDMRYFPMISQNVPNFLKILSISKFKSVHRYISSPKRDDFIG